MTMQEPLPPRQIPPTRPRSAAAAPVPRPDRRFYAQTQAFGRFGIRWFDPQIMPGSSISTAISSSTG